MFEGGGGGGEIVVCSPRILNAMLVVNGVSEKLGAANNKIIIQQA